LLLCWLFTCRIYLKFPDEQVADCQILVFDALLDKLKSGKSDYLNAPLWNKKFHPGEISLDMDGCSSLEKQCTRHLLRTFFRFSSRLLCYQIYHSCFSVDVLKRRNQETTASLPTLKTITVLLDLLSRKSTSNNCRLLHG
jgi:hypothetical protein